MKVFTIIFCCAFLALLYPVRAQSNNGLVGEFYNSKNLSGNIVRTRVDSVIDFDFGYDAPISGVNVDNFSIRWTGQLVAPVTGNYTISTYSDDGIRVWLNGNKIIDNWTDHAPVFDDSASIQLIAGQKYDLKIEYFEGVLGAQIQLYWAYPGVSRQIVPSSQLLTGINTSPPIPILGNGTGLRGDYYPNLDFIGAPVIGRIDNQVNFNWGGASPAVGIGADFFSVRWTGQVLAPITGNIVFSTISDDGIRLYINNQLVIGNWTLHAATVNSSLSIPMIAGQKYDIRLEFFENTGDAVAQLHWNYFGQPDQVIPAQYLFPANSTYLSPTLPTLELTKENKDAARFLMQSTYGPTLSDIIDIRSKGYENWLTEQFNQPLQLHRDYLAAIRDGGGKIYNEQARESFWTQALTGRDQLRQRVALALSEIFVVSELGGMLDNQPQALASYLDLLNRNAFGNFRQLLEDVTLHPAMGRYLDMLGNEKEDASIGRTPNENYAREVLQLFSIGLYQLNNDGSFKLDSAKKPIPTYDLEEVKGFARIFTGWNWGGNSLRTDANWSFPPIQYQWDYPMQAWPTRHSTGEKQLLNNFIVPDGQTPEKDLKDALDNIFNHPNVGPFIGRQLIQKLVTSNPSHAYIDRVASAFNDNGSGVRGDLKAVIRAILLDPEARSISRDPYGYSRSGTDRSGYSNNQAALTNAVISAVGKLREPMIRWGHLMRAFSAESPGGRYRIWYVDSTDSALGQSPLRAPSVFNFFEPTYAVPGIVAKAGIASPEFKLANETTVIGGANFTLNTIYYGYGDYTGYPVTMNFTGYVPWAADPPKLVDQLNLILMAGSMTQGMRNSIVNAIGEMPASGLGDRLRAAVFLIATSKEFVIQK